jgi:hypothetical protein
MKARVLSSGIVAPGAVGVEAFDARVRSESSGLYTVNDFGDAGDAVAQRWMRLDRMALAAARQALGQHSPEGVALVFATGFGESTATASFLDSVATRGPAFGSPRDFTLSVHHAAAGQLSIALRLKGLSLTQSGREVSGEGALEVACALLEAKRATRVLVVAADECTPALEFAFSSFGVLAPTDSPVRPGHRGMRLGEGAAAVLLGPAHEGFGPKVRSISRTAHPVSGLRFPRSELGPLLSESLQKLPSGKRHVLAAACGADFDSDELSAIQAAAPEATVTCVSKQLGIHPGAGIFKLAYAANRLIQSPEMGTFVSHGVAMGGQQVLFEVVSDAR